MLKNLINRTFGRLTVIRRGTRKAKNVYWLCLCSCGKRKQIRNDILQNGTVVSCGCFFRESASFRALTHGHTARSRRSRGSRQSPEYMAYYMQRDACQNPHSKNAQWYRDRGIQFLFSTFQQFLSHVGRKPGPDFWLVRIDRSKDVAPGNVTWRPIKRHRRKRKRKSRSK
jgi:hypothetical protein